MFEKDKRNLTLLMVDAIQSTLKLSNEDVQQIIANIPLVKYLNALFKAKEIYERLDEEEVLFVALINASYKSLLDAFFEIGLTALQGIADVLGL